MQEETTPVTGTPGGFPADLTREEFLAYYMLSARTVGPLRGRKGQLVLNIVLFVLLIGGLAYAYVELGELEWPVAMLLLLLMAVATALWTAIPIRLHKQAAATYDRSVESGYSYYGIVEVRPTEIVKTGQELTTSIPLNATTLFIEDKDMMVWINRQGRSIVLPARCLTPETAGAVRAAADRLPAQNRRFIARLIPGCQPVEEPAPIPIVTLWERQIRYTPEEYAAIAKSRVVSQFWRRLPQMMMMSFCLALVFAWPEASLLRCVLVFLGTLAAQVVFGLVLPYTRIPRQPQDLPASRATVQVTFTDRGVKLRDGDNFVSVPWSAVEHVYDRGDYAELLYQHQSVRIPKREIEDIDAFNGILEHYWKNK